MARRGLRALCLCLALLGCWLSLPESIRAQDTGGTAVNRAAELAQSVELNEQVMKLYSEGRYAEAIPLAVLVLAGREQWIGTEHLSVAHALGNLARLYEALGDNERAELLYRRALAVYEKALGPESLDVALTLNNLAALYGRQGDYVRAEPLYRRALGIRERALGPDHPDVALSLNNLASLHMSKGDYVRAELLFRRALAIDEKALGPKHPDIAADLNNFAELYRSKGDLERAEPFYRRSLAVSEKALGPEHPHVAISLTNLGLLYVAMGDLAGAEPLLRRALAIDEKAFGIENPNTATDLLSLAELYVVKGELTRAESLLQRALSIYEKALGPEHPFVVRSLNEFATLYRAKSDFAGAVQFQSRGNEVSERNLALILASGSERQKLAYLQSLAGETYATVSLHARSAPQDRLALRLALTTILRRKGRALDATADQVAGLRRRLDPQDRALLDRLSAAQARLATLVLGGPGKAPPTEHRAAVSRLEEAVELLQDAVSRRSAEFRARMQPITVEQVRRSLPAGAALVEFFSYRPFDVKAKTEAGRYGPARYVAYVLGGAGEPLWADLGATEDVDAGVSRLLTAVTCPQAVGKLKRCPAVSEVKRLARAVDERVMRPARRLLGGARHVFLSPDGALNLLPFAALVDEEGKYLVEGYLLTYLTSGRDLLRLQAGGAGRQPPLIVADPLFGSRPGAGGGARGTSEGGGRRSAELGPVYFPPLPGTAAEARALSSILPGVRVLTQAQATEAALKQVAGPRVLHVATHGFFLPDRPTPAAGATRGLTLGGGVAPAASAQIENSLLRSGLALAGANRRRDANGDDGILTALEAAALDLWGTELVALSACETGVGEVKTGEGVYGLRRALVLAGSQSQVMSLWQVSDEATKDLMVSYYKRLAAGEGRTEALRRVQLSMLEGRGPARAGGRRGIGDDLGAARIADRKHPYYWAAFIQSGDWRGLGAQPSVAK